MLEPWWYSSVEYIAVETICVATTFSTASFSLEVPIIFFKKSTLLMYSPIVSLGSLLKFDQVLPALVFHISHEFRHTIDIRKMWDNLFIFFLIQNINTQV